MLDNISSSPLGDIYQNLAQQVRSSGQEQHLHMVPRITLAGKYTIISSAQSSHSPSILVLSASNSKHTVHITPIRAQHLVRVTALAVDQSSRTSANLHIAACLSNGDIYVHELHSHPRKHYYAPPFKTPRTAPIIQAAYCHPVLVTLSESFTLSVYTGPWALPKSFFKKLPCTRQLRLSHRQRGVRHHYSFPSAARAHLTFLQVG